MSNIAVNLAHVAYNAATQSFEALAIVVSDGIRKTYPVSVPAAITTDFARAKTLLERAALKPVTHGLTAQRVEDVPVARIAQYLNARKRRGLPVGQYGFFRGQRQAA